MIKYRLCFGLLIIAIIVLAGFQACTNTELGTPIVGGYAFEPTVEIWNEGQNGEIIWSMDPDRVSSSIVILMDKANPIVNLVVSSRQDDVDKWILIEKIEFVDDGRAGGLITNGGAYATPGRSIVAILTEGERVTRSKTRFAWDLSNFTELVNPDWNFTTTPIIDGILISKYDIDAQALSSPPKFRLVWKE